MNSVNETFTENEINMCRRQILILGVYGSTNNRTQIEKENWRKSYKHKYKNEIKSIIARDPNGKIDRENNKTLRKTGRTGGNLKIGRMFRTAYMLGISNSEIFIYVVSFLEISVILEFNKQEYENEKYQIK